MQIFLLKPVVKRDWYLIILTSWVLLQPADSPSGQLLHLLQVSALLPAPSWLGACRGPSAARVPCCRPGCAHEDLLHEASNHLCGSWQWKNGLHLSPCSQRLNLEDIKSSRYGQLFKLSVLSICIHPTVCVKSSSGRCSSSKRVDEREVCFLAHPP